MSKVSAAQVERVFYYISSESHTPSEVAVLSGFRRRNVVTHLRALEKSGVLRVNGRQRHGESVYHVVRGKTFEDFRVWQCRDVLPAPETHVTSRDEFQKLVFLETMRSCIVTMRSCIDKLEGILLQASAPVASSPSSSTKLSNVSPNESPSSVGPQIGQLWQRDPRRRTVTFRVKQVTLTDIITESGRSIALDRMTRYELVPDELT